jgi:hypothetical protein
MSARGDRAIRQGHGPLAVAIVLLVAMVGGGVLFWSRFERSPAAVPAATVQPTAAEEPVRPDEPMPLTLFVPVNAMLEPVSSGIRRQPELQLEAREAAEAVLSSERAASAAVLKDLKLRALYSDGAGTVFVDLSSGSGQGETRGSAWDELLAVYSLVDTLTQNFPDVRQVRFLIEGREAVTLAGHVDLTRTFVKRTDLVRYGEEKGEH